MVNHSRIKVLIVDEHMLSAEGMESLLLQESGIKVIGIALNTADCLELVKKAHPDVILLNINLLEICNVNIIDLIKNKFPETKIIMIAGQSHEGYVETFLVKGVAGCLLKDCTKKEVVTAIRKAIKGEVYFSQSLSVYLESFNVHFQNGISDPDVFSVREATFVAKDSQDVLTKRESEILALIAKGLRNKEIAASLQITKRTVEYHVSNILEKLGVKSRLEAALNYNDIKVD
jgi:DNA-binding NarL/FixJ family response regulator